MEVTPYPDSVVGLLVKSANEPEKSVGLLDRSVYEPEVATVAKLEVLAFKAIAVSIAVFV
jgi:hypothetical protein